MARPRDPVQRHIAAVYRRDSIAPDDASDLALSVDAPPKIKKRLLQAMLPGVDYPADDDALAKTDDPVGRRVGRVAFNPCIAGNWKDGVWIGGGPQPHRLPNSKSDIARFHRQQTLLHDGDPNTGTSDALVEKVIGFPIDAHARTSAILSQGGKLASVLVAILMLAAACDRFERRNLQVNKTRRHIDDWEAAIVAVEVATNGAAQIAADVLLGGECKRKGIQTIALAMAYVAEKLRRNRPLRPKLRIGSLRCAAQAAAMALACLATGKLDRNWQQPDVEVQRLPHRLETCASGVADRVANFVSKVRDIDTPMVYRLLMARRLDVALTANPWLAAPHPSFRVCYGFLGGHAIFAELERVGLIVKHMADRQRVADGSPLQARSIRSCLSDPQQTGLALQEQNAAGRYLDLGVYHAEVTNAFVRQRKRWMRDTVVEYTHHAYATGTRRCNLPAAAADDATHAMIRGAELRKPTMLAQAKQNLVLFYGLPIKDVVILALRQISDRVLSRKCNVEEWRKAFGHTTHLVLSHVDPEIARQLSASSCLMADQATCKGLANRATEFARRFDDRDYDRPVGAFFDYARWFDRDRDVAFWNRLQGGAKLYAAFGSSYIPSRPTETEGLPPRQGRSTVTADARSRWAEVMLKAKRAFDAYEPLYAKTRPRFLNAQIMTRLSEGYSSLASDPQFWAIFKMR